MALICKFFYVVQTPRLFLLLPLTFPSFRENIQCILNRFVLRFMEEAGIVSRRRNSERRVIPVQKSNRVNKHSTRVVQNISSRLQKFCQPILSSPFLHCKQAPDRGEYTEFLVILFRPLILNFCINSVSKVSFFPLIIYFSLIKKNNSKKNSTKSSLQIFSSFFP